MKRAQLYLWSVLHSHDNLDDVAISDLASRAARELYIADPEQRRSDMEAAVGIWAERAELFDTETYICNLRDDLRSARHLQA